LEGPENVTVSRDTEDGAIVLRAAHDGYAERFGIIHERFAALSEDGNRLDGEDIFLPASGNSLPENALDHFAVRFHLHPSIRANRLTDGHGAVLLLPNKDVWNLDAHEDEVALEESVYLAGQDGPRRTTQVVIYGRAREFHRVHWTFSHVPHLAPGAKRPRAPEPELPL
jgi:uncharacterized heparinase superfamily protein